MWGTRGVPVADEPGTPGRPARAGARRPGRSTRPGPAAGGTGGRCSTRPTRRGTSPTWSSAPAWPRVVNVTRLIATLLAFFCAVGLAAHALDELHGRPLRTQIPAGALVAVAVVGLAGAVGARHRRCRPGRPGPGPVPRVGPAPGRGLQLRALRRASSTTTSGSPPAGARSRCWPPTWPRPAGWPWPRSWPPPVPSPCRWRSGPSARRPDCCAVGPRLSTARCGCGTGRHWPSTGSVLAPLERALRAMSWAVVLLAAALAVARLT